jgi:hypothetical protein
MSNNLTDEKKTIRYMIEIYCRGEHKASFLCNECVDLLNYAVTRLDKCPLDKSKVTCNKCKIHCYEPKQREKIREVMKYSGPRMLYRHPISAIKHMRKEIRK